MHYIIQSTCIVIYVEIRIAAQALMLARTHCAMRQARMQLLAKGKQNGHSLDIVNVRYALTAAFDR